jgi:parvulin-like peptidyl-prolyl isomerase
MRFSWLVSLLFVCLAWGQSAAPPAPAAPPTKAGQPEQTASAASPAAKPAEVAPTDPVLTLKGLCQDPSKDAGSCQTVVTKEQFEKLANALQPNMAPQVRRQLAAAYSKMLAMSMAAEKKGLDKGPQFDEMLGFARMQILSQILSRNMQEEAQNVSDADIQKYYDDNKSAFEEANFQRIFVPKTRQSPPPTAKPVSPAGVKSGVKPKVKPTAFELGDQAEPGEKGEASTPKSAAAAKKLSPEDQQKANEEAMKKVAESLQKRAVAGEDFETIQKAAYTAAGIKGQAPPVKMEKVRRTSLPTTQSAVFDLKEGAISDVITDPSGYYIYKMVKKQTLPLDAVKNEIKNTISSQRYRDSMQAVQQLATPELNDAYFGAPRPPGPPGMPMMPPRGGKPNQPPSDPDQD